VPAWGGAGLLLTTPVQPVGSKITGHCSDQI